MALANEFQYLVQYGVMTDENGLLHMNARYYLPEAKRFLARGGTKGDGQLWQQGPEV